MRTALVLSASIVVLLEHVTFMLGLVYRRNDVADAAWPVGFMLIAWALVLVTSSAVRPAIIALLVTFWGMRLALHIFRRLRRNGEDPRYAAWRATWRWFRLRSYLQVYLLQGALLWIVSLPLLWSAAFADAPLGMWDVIGVALWCMGFAMESVADRQLASFLADAANRGRLFTAGLWRYSRHPNYFGEALQWWGIATMTVALPGGVWSLVSPVLLTILLRFVSGVPMLERRYVGRSDFEAYRARTNAFFPWWPRA